MKREQALEFSEALDMMGAGWYRQVVLAGELEVPQALGLTWQVWVKKYLPKLKHSVDDRRERVRALAASEIAIDGERRAPSNREIAALLGVDHETVNRDRRRDRGIGANAPLAPQESSPSMEPEASAGADAPPDTADRAERVTRDNRAEQKRAERTEREAAIQEVPSPDLRVGSLGEVLAEIREVDLVFTDPPYPRQFLPVWSELGRWARHALKPGALLVAYSGTAYLPEVLSRLEEHLTYQWLGWVITAGPAVAIRQKPIQAGGKPLLFFSNGALSDPYASRPFSDTVKSERRTRELHTWEQDESPAAYYIEALTERGERVVDPFLGSGTFAVVAHRLGREVIGCDIDEKAVETTRRRFQSVA